MSSMGPACGGASTLNSGEAEHTVALFRPIGDARSGYLPAITSRCPPRSDGSGWQQMSGHSRRAIRLSAAIRCCPTRDSPGSGQAWARRGVHTSWTSCKEGEKGL